MKTDLTNLEHLRQTALESKALIMEVIAELPVSRSAVLTAAGWTGSGPYTQKLTVAGVRADEAGQLIQPVPAAASLAAWNAADVSCTVQGAGTLTFSAQTKPSANLSIFVILQEV